MNGKKFLENPMILVGGLFVFGGLLMAILVMIILAVYLADTKVMPIVTILLVSMGGILGGLGFEIKDDQFNFPNRDRRTKNTFSPGCLGSVLYGLIGGFVIFLLIPGNFDLSAGPFEVVKLFALAVIGGYGGRVLIEKALDKQMADMQKQFQEIQDQPSFDAKAMDAVEQQLDGDPDTNVTEDELKESINKASASVLVWAFDKARNFRRRNLRANNRDEIALVVPIFEALIAVDQEDNEQEKYHRNFAQLGYALKDQQSPDNARAIEVFTKAIEVRDRGADKGSYLLYEFNRAICKIRENKDFESIKADLNVAMLSPKTASFARGLDSKIDSDLVAWYESNKKDLKSWFDDNYVSLTKIRANLKKQAEQNDG